MAQARGWRVLIVDDEVDFVEVLAERLRTRGLAVTAVHDGLSAIESVAETRFDAVILDLAMPGMDGIETLSELRRISPEIQVILLTGHATLESGVKAMKLGAMDFLEKPVDINALVERIRDAGVQSTEAAANQMQSIIDDIVKTKGW